MDSRVSELALTVRAPGDRLGALGHPAERFAKRVLERCDELLEARAPGRVVLLRTFDMHWRLVDGGLHVESEVEAFADKVAEAIDARAREATTTPVPSDDVAVFENEAAWRASYLACFARRAASDAWYFAPLQREGEPPGALTRAENHALAIDTVNRLAHDGLLEGVLTALPIRATVALAKVVLGDKDGVTGEASGSSGSARSDARAPENNGRWRERLVAFARSVGTRPHAAANATGFTAPPSTFGVSLAIPDLPIDAPPSIETAYGGLFYLLNAAIELNVGEALWKVCVDEPAILVRAAAAILGPEAGDDPAASLFAGVPLCYPLAPVPADAQCEVALVLYESLLRALPRRGLASLPEVTLAVAGSPGGRVLLATPRASTHVLFAAPADTPQQAKAAVAAFLDHWPRSATAPHASTAIAELDVSTRLVAERGLLAPPLALTDVPDRFAAMLVAQVAGSVAHLFETRVGGADVVRRIPVAARVWLEAERMRVEMPMESIDIDVRRAGFDASPGWVAWLRRKVEISFATHKSKA